MSLADKTIYPFTPTDRSGQIGPVQEGMTLLEHYSGLAMQGRLASVGFEQAFNCGHEDYAQWSVGMAKALIAELNKQSVKES